MIFLKWWVDWQKMFFLEKAGMVGSSGEAGTNFVDWYVSALFVGTDLAQRVPKY
jgi:hypothetical protein